MHELAVTKSILRLVLDTARDINAGQIKTISLTVGEMRNLEQEWIQKYFDYISKDTIAEGAGIIVRKTPVIFGCKQCGQQFSADIHAAKMILCPDCGSENYSLLSGRELLVDNIEVI